MFVISDVMHNVSKFEGQSFCALARFSRYAKLLLAP